MCLLPSRANYVQRAVEPGGVCSPASCLTLGHATETKMSGSPKASDVKYL